jgi:hypothetical protein
VRKFTIRQDVFTRASLSGTGTPGVANRGYLAHEHTILGDYGNPRIDAAEIPSIWIWDLSTLSDACVTVPPNCPAPVPGQCATLNIGTSAGNPPAATVLVGSSPLLPIPPPVAGGFRAHVAARATASQPEFLVYEQHETDNHASDLNQDGDLVDYFYFHRYVTGTVLSCPVTIGHPRAMCGSNSPQSMFASKGAEPTLDAQRPTLATGPLDNEGNLTTTLDEAEGVPLLTSSPLDGTFFGEDAIRMDASFPGLLAFSTNIIGFWPPPPPPSGQSQREVPDCEEELLAYHALAISRSPVFFPFSSHENNPYGLYPTISGRYMAFLTREFAGNIHADFDGDGAIDHILVRGFFFDPTTGTKGPNETIGCGYGPSVETTPTIDYPDWRPAQIVAFLTPENGVFDDPSRVCPVDVSPFSAGCAAVPAPCGPAFGNLNENLCFPPPAFPGGPTHRDSDECDIVVRFLIR